MNRKQQGSHSRGQGQSQAQHQPRGARPIQSNQGYQSYDQDNDYEGMQMGGSRQGQRGNSYDSYDSYDVPGSSSYRGVDYDLDGSTSGNTSRSQRSFSERPSRSPYNEYETNDRNREPSRYSSLDSSLDEEKSLPSERYNSSSDRFGYPASMNSWKGNDRSAGMSRSTGRVGQSNMQSWGAQDYETGMGSQFGSQSEMGMGARPLSSDYSSDRTEKNDKGFFGKGPKGYKRSDDRIKEDVCETLARNPRVDASDIEVKVEESCVTLSGMVDNKEIKRAAEMAIENLSGVDDVRNEIRVRKMGERGAEDSIHASSSPSASSGSSLHGRDSAGHTAGSKSSAKS